MSTKSANLTAPEHWNEWFEKCALLRCGDATKEALGRFAHLRFKKYLLEYLDMRGLSENEMPSEAKDLVGDYRSGVCWRELEAEYWNTPKPPETGESSSVASTPPKSYKKFYREVSSSLPDAESSRNYLEGATTKFLIRTRCRKLIQKGLLHRLATEEELRSASNKPVSDGVDDSLLPMDHDIQVAEDIFGFLDVKDRILLLAKQSNMSLKNERITNRLEMGHSALYQHQDKAVAKVRGLLERRKIFRRDSLRIVHVLHKMLTDWALSPECGIGECLMGGET